ncbi:MAG TPA: flap endonuclease-1 [Terriglobia bacterium]|nr:flap endonuclease-1 [Terriglobia bacterium]
MGVLLTPIIVKREVALDDLRGQPIAVDANGELYQFLALIRLRDGSPLADSRGRITSHLSGLFYRTTRLISDYGIQMIFVFDGKPPALKSAEIARRRSIKERYEAEYKEAIQAGDLERAYSKATMTSRLTREMVDEARELLRLLGMPVVQAPSEGEAQASHMAAAGTVWAAGSKDYDCLLFGTPRLLRFLTISGKEFLPSKGSFRSITPELIETRDLLSHYNITREQLIDLAILVGTDFNDGIKGIGPKKALKLVSEFGTIDNMPVEIRDAVGPVVGDIRSIFMHPEVTDDYSIRSEAPDAGGVIRFLCDEHEFSRERVTAALERAFPSSSQRERTLF